MTLRLDNESGIIKIGSPPKEIPGIVESIKISDSLLIENAEIQGRSGKVKVVQGWDDVAMQISLSLIDNPGAGKTRWDSLKEIAGIFKKVGNNGKPETYTVSHPMIRAWGTKQLLISSLESTESRTRRKISVSIEFVEHDSSVGIIQDRQSPEAPADAAQTAPAPLVSDRQRRGLGKLEDRYAKL
jgi:hypothetical protein